MQTPMVVTPDNVLEIGRQERAKFLLESQQAENERIEKKRASAARVFAEVVKKNLGLDELPVDLTDPDFPWSVCAGVEFCVCYSARTILVRQKCPDCDSYLISVPVRDRSEFASAVDGDLWGPHEHFVEDGSAVDELGPEPQRAAIEAMDPSEHVAERLVQVLMGIELALDRFCAAVGRIG